MVLQNLAQSQSKKARAESVRSILASGHPLEQWQLAMFDGGLPLLPLTPGKHKIVLLLAL